MGPDIRLRFCLILASLCVLFTRSQAFYIPGYSVRSYKDGDSVPLLVNKIFSSASSLQYAYFDLPFVCPPTGKKHGDSPFSSGHSLSLNIGEVLRGDRIAMSDFELEMGKDVACQSLCSVEVGREDVKWTRKLISQSYAVEWIVDNLPGATSFVTVDKTQKYYSMGFPIGYKDYTHGNRPYMINNHFTFVIRWRKAPGKAGDRGGKVIVGFEVYPRSIDRDNRLEDGCPKDFGGENSGLELYISPNNTRLAEKYPGSSYLPEDDLDMDDGATITIPYTYSVYFRKESKVHWSNRWALYFNSQQEGKVTHWLAIVNSLVILILLSVAVYVIWGRTVQGNLKGRGDGVGDKGLKRGRKGPRSQDSEEEPSNGLLDVEKGDDDDSLSDDEGDEGAPWKRLHGDVFRNPAYSGLLAPLVGSGTQLLFMAAGLLLLSCFGVLNPSFRGGFISVGMGLFVFAGLFSGYFSARLYRTLGGQNWQRNTLITALFFPGLLFCETFILNLFVWAQASSTALPFNTLLALVALWLLIQVPLVYISSWYGYVKAKPWEHPTRTSSIPRQIPPQWWYLRSIQGTLLTGFVPFAVLFVELLFVFKNMVQDKSGYYYVFGYLSVVCTIMIITVSEVTVIATYYQLCAEDHRWWWQSFITGGSSAVWVFMYCVWYYFAKMQIQGFISSLLFFSYSVLGCAVYGLLTGTVGFLTAYAFIRRIYSSVKVD